MDALKNWIFFVRIYYFWNNSFQQFYDRFFLFLNLFPRIISLIGIHVLQWNDKYSVHKNYIYYYYFLFVCVLVLRKNERIFLRCSFSFLINENIYGALKFTELRVTRHSKYICIYFLERGTLAQQRFIDADRSDLPWAFRFFYVCVHLTLSLPRDCTY